MAPIPSPYPSGCKIARNDPRSYCTCAGGCKSDYPPPDRWVINVQPTTKTPFSDFVGRRILKITSTATDTCIWETDPGAYPRPLAVANLAKTVSAPSGDLRWELRFHFGFLCVTAAAFQADGTGMCCKDLYWGLSVIWFGTACAFGPGINPEIDIWPVRFDFTEADL